MPIYDYKCKNCQAVFEVRASFKEKESGLQPECPQCNSWDVNQVMTAGLFLQIGGDAVASRLPTCGPNSGPGCCG